MYKNKIVAVNKNTGSKYTKCVKSPANPSFYRVSKHGRSGSWLVGKKQIQLVK